MATTTKDTTNADGKGTGAKGRRSAAAAAAAQVLAQASAQAARDLVITETLHASGAAFNISEADRVENGPIMSGRIRVDGGDSIPLSLFREIVEETGVEYASLSFGSKGCTHWHGKLFRTDSPTGPHYSGYIVCLPVSKPEQYTPEQWEKATKLQICGWRRRGANGQARISLSVAPKHVATSEMAF